MNERAHEHDIFALELDGRGLVQVRAATHRADAAAVDTTLLAAILRRSSEHMTPKASIAAQLDEAREKGWASGKAEGESGRAERQDADALALLRRRVTDFEEAAGIRIDEFAGPRVGRAFALASALVDVDADWRLQGVERALEDSLREVRRTRANLLSQEPDTDNHPKGT